jgi:hypothetical protein
LAALTYVRGYSNSINSFNTKDTKVLNS